MRGRVPKTRRHRRKLSNPNATNPVLLKTRPCMSSRPPKKVLLLLGIANIGHSNRAYFTDGLTARGCMAGHRIQGNHPPRGPPDPCAAVSSSHDGASPSHSVTEKPPWLSHDAPADGDGTCLANMIVKRYLAQQGDQCQACPEGDFALSSPRSCQQLLPASHPRPCPSRLSSASTSSLCDCSSSAWPSRNARRSSQSVTPARRW